MLKKSFSPLIVKEAVWFGTNTYVKDDTAVNIGEYLKAVDY